MANYDLGTIGYTVQNTGAPKSIAELKEFARAGLEAHKNAKQLSQGDHLSRYFSSVDRQISVVNRNMQNYNRFVSQAGQNSGRFGVVTQQAGYQIGDFLVQVQSGTNWMVAFGQQATQLAGILPLMGAGFMGLSTGALVALSAGLGIIIPLLTAVGAAFIRTGEDSENSSTGLDRYAEAMTGVGSAIAKTQLEIEKLTFKTEDPVIAAARASLREAEQNLYEARKNQRRIGSVLAPTTAESAALREVVIKWAEASSLLRELEEKNKALAEAQRMLNGDLSTAAGIQKGLIYDKEVELRIAKEAKATQEALKAAFDNVSLAAQSAAQATANIGTAAQGAIGFVQNLGIAMWNAAQTRIKADAALAAMKIEFSPGGQSMMEYGGRGVVSNRPVTLGTGEIVGASVGGGVGGGGGAAQEDALQKLREQIALENELLGVSEAQKRVIQALGEQRSQYSEAEINAVTAEIEAYNQKLEVLKQQQELADVLKSSMEDAFMSIIEGTESAKDAFKKMAYEVIKELYRVLVVQRLVGSFNSQTGTGTGLVGLIAGVFGGRESGGSVMAGQPYMVGERGPELVIPRHSGTVMNANLTRQAASGGGDVIVTNNINVPAGADSASIRAEVSKMIPQITQITKAAVIDAKQRGGQMSAAFR